MPHIAIIEDEPDIPHLLGHCFTCEGFQVTIAHDGPTGLDVVRRLGPDLVILDLFLPHLSGWDVSDPLKAREETRAIPILVLSANGDVANRIRRHPERIPPPPGSGGISYRQICRILEFTWLSSNCNALG
jgi:two-component system, OmpR family, phosphate regulon response regulator PhoB